VALSAKHTSLSRRISRMKASLDGNKSDILIIPASLYFIIIYAIPLIFLLLKSVWTPDGFSLASYGAFLTDPFGWRVISNTLWIAFWVSSLSVLVGYPMAIALSRSRGWVQVFLFVALILPLSVGAVVKTFSWQIVLRRDGAINLLLQKLGLIDEPLRLLFTEPGLMIGAVNILLPFMVLPIYSVLKQIDPQIGNAAATLGAGPIYRFLHVNLPLSLPGIIAGTAFVFSMSVAMYVIPSLLIGDRYQTLATLTGRSFLFLRNEQLGATTAVILLVISLVVIVVSERLNRRLHQ
jgi:putative spermidine/putrescine transport system permease protein